MPDLTPIERLEKWHAGSKDRILVIATHRYIQRELGRVYAVGLWEGDCRFAWALAPTLDAAILAALAQAEEGRCGNH